MWLANILFVNNVKVVHLAFKSENFGCASLCLCICAATTTEECEEKTVVYCGKYSDSNSC